MIKSCCGNTGSFDFRSGIALLALTVVAAWPVTVTADDRVYTITYEGSVDHVTPGTDADAYWKGCALDEPSAHVGATNPEIRKPLCMKLMLIWGLVFARDGASLSDEKRARQTDRLEPEQVEHERGKVYTQKALELLRGDLDGLKDRALNRRLTIHHLLGMDVNWFGLGVFNKDLTAVHGAAVNYYWRVWNLLPDSPSTFEEFRYKFDTAEQLKEVFNEILYKNEAGRLGNIVPIAATFIEQAFAFHRISPPDPVGQRPPRILKARIQDEFNVEGVGYGIYPGERRLQPLYPLLHTDLVIALKFLQTANDGKLMDSSELEPRIKNAQDAIGTLKVAELQAWIDRYHKRNDRFSEAETREKLAAAYAARGNAAAAEREQEALCDLLFQTGDRLQWALQMVELAKFRVAAKEWKAVLAMLPPVQLKLLGYNELKPLLEAIACQGQAWKALGMKPDVDWEAKLTPWVDDLKTVPVQRLGSDVSEATINRLQDWLKQPGHLASMRFSVRLDLARALTARQMYEQAETVAKGLLPDAERAECKEVRFDLLGRLLTIESARGNLGEFYSTLDQYQRAGRDLHGENWLQTDGLPIAQVLYRLRDFPRAEAVLAAQEEREQWQILRDSRFMPNGIDGVRYEDLMLQARIELERGRKAAAGKQIAELETYASAAGSKAVQIGGVEDAKLDLLQQLAELNTAIGQTEKALGYARQVLNGTDQMKQTERWLTAKIVEARALLALKRDASEDVARFQDMAPHLAQHKELGAGHAVDMEVVIADYYALKGDAPKTVEWLNKALALAKDLGAIDEEVEAHRKLGDATISATDRSAAIEEYRRSISLLSAVSASIPSDLGKVGYRGERDLAISRLALALYDQYRATGAKQNLEEMFQVVEGGKARAFAEMMFGRADAALRKFGAADVKGALPADGLLLEYYIPEDARDAVFRFQIDQGGMTAVLLPVGASEVKRRVQSLLDDAINSSDSYDDAAFRRKAAVLGGVLLPESLGGKREILIVPAGPLYLFPFSLLAGADGRFVDENDGVALSYLPNAAFLLKQPPRISDLKGSAGFGNPAGEPQQASTAAIPALREGLDQAFHKWSGGAIAWEQPLTPAQFLDRAPQIDNMFLYSHATFLPGDPVSSYIKLSPSAADDGNLSAERLLTQKIGRGLWVLAACSTGSGDVESGDEVLGLPRALLEAGASSVVVSLWEVDQVVSMRLMTAFYNNLASGMTPSKALRAAADQLRRTGRPPFDWAPFILTGQYGFRN